MELLLNILVTSALLLYKQTVNKIIKVSEFRMWHLHLIQCHENMQSSASSSIIVRKRLRHKIQKKERD